jgi:hypothetical protein
MSIGILHSGLGTLQGLSYRKGGFPEIMMNI